jgi:hypothetical protein
MNYEDIPLIANVRYLCDYAFLISFSNGEDRICDLTDSFNLPIALGYSAALYKDFSFDSYTVWWGDRDREDCMEIGHDSLYNMPTGKKDDLNLLLDEFVQIMGDMAFKLWKSVMDVDNIPLNPDIVSMNEDQILAALASAREAYHSPIDLEISLLKGGCPCLKRQSLLPTMFSIS